MTLMCYSYKNSDSLVVSSTLWRKDYSKPENLINTQGFIGGFMVYGEILKMAVFEMLKAKSDSLLFFNMCNKEKLKFRYINFLIPTNSLIGLNFLNTHTQMHTRTHAHTIIRRLRKEFQSVKLINKLNPAHVENCCKLQYAAGCFMSFCELGQLAIIYVMRDLMPLPTNYYSIRVPGLKISQSFEKN